jgi:hypothetical protein
MLFLVINQDDKAAAVIVKWINPHVTRRSSNSRFRKATRRAQWVKIVTFECRQPGKDGLKAFAALIFCRALFGMPAGNRVVPVPDALTEVIRRRCVLDVQPAALPWAPISIDMASFADVMHS